jgi:hypothetical protein
MTNLSQPQDNLYKYMAVSGIVLIIAGFIGPPVFFQQTEMEYVTQLRGTDELKLHEKFTRQRLETLRLRGDRAKDELNKLQKRMEELKPAPDSAEADKLEGRIKEANREIDSIADASYELSLNLALKQAQIESEETVSFNRRRTARLFVLIGWIAGLLGLCISFIGFRRWYIRLQKYQDLLAAKEAEAKLAAATNANKQKAALP